MQACTCTTYTSIYVVHICIDFDTSISLVCLIMIQRFVCWKWDDSNNERGQMNFDLRKYVLLVIIRFICSDYVSITGYYSFIIILQVYNVQIY